MEPYYEDTEVVIYHGDCQEVLPQLTKRVDTCITDPPYGLNFMGKAWDHAVPDETYWREVLRVVKPGGMLLAFGGTRLWHWLAVGIELAEWEIRDTLMWLYGTGFPKSLDISKALDKAAGEEREVVGEGRSYTRSEDGFGRYGMGGVYRPGEHTIEETAPATEEAKLWDGWGTALKPAWEPIIMAMRPLDGTFAENAVTHGVAGLHIDDARVGTEEMEVSRSDGTLTGKRSHSMAAPYTGRIVLGTKPGRWPTNLVLDEDAAQALDEQSGTSRSPQTRARSPDPPAGATYGLGREGGVQTGYGDEGGASRFFYTSKAVRDEFNDHPTLKPLDLMQYLCRLTATPTGGVVLDPFMGSGTTLVAAKSTSRRAVGIEKEEEYCEIAAKRCAATTRTLLSRMAGPRLKPIQSPDDPPEPESGSDAKPAGGVLKFL